MRLRYLMIGVAAVGLLGLSRAKAQAKDGASIGVKGPRSGVVDLERPEGARRGAGLNPRIGPKKGRGPGGPPPPPSALIDRWRQMSPEERQQAVDRLPPARREAFRRRMEMWDSLNPSERKGVSDRFDRFRDLSPEQQRTARQAFRQFNQLPLERRQQLRREVTVLRGLNDEERAARLSSDEFRNRFDSRERGLIADLTTSLPE